MKKLAAFIVAFMLVLPAWGTYETDYALSQDATFQSRLAVAMRDAALDIAGEAPSGKDTMDRLRQQLAFSVLNDDDDVWLKRFAIAACEGGALGSTGAPPGDADIKTRLSAIWDDMAGIEMKYR